MLGPGPGPAPTPSLTLPSLRELDKALGPESEHGRIPNHQPRSQSSDPHLHQHFHQQRPQPQHGHGSLQNQYTPHSSLASSQQGYQHHDQSRRFSSSGSLPDLYMSSPSAPPSTATSSSLSRVDSISSMDYLQNNLAGRRTSSSANGGGLTNPTETETVNSQQEPAPSSSAPAAASATGTATVASVNANENGGAVNNTSSSGNQPQQQQGRNSTKRAAQNRAAQRAFRQRKDLYVRELERKADLLQQAESKIAHLSARNRELEEMVFQAQQYRQGSSSSPMLTSLPQQQPHHRQDSPITGISIDRVERERGRESDREWERERDWTLRERTHNHTDSIGAPPYDHFNSSPIARPALGRHSSHQHLRQAYNSSSPPLSSEAFKHLSLNNKLPSHLHDQQRPESDHEIEMQSRPSRHLHRHPSESSLNLGRGASFPLSSTGGSADSRVDMASSSPVPNAINSTARANKASFAGSLGALPPSGPHDVHHYPGSPLTPTHERIPLYASNQETSSAYDVAKKRPSDGTINWSGSSSGPGSDLYRSTPDPHPHHPYHSHHAVKKQASWSSLSDQRRLQHSLKKQPSWGSISEYRHSWRTTESPEMISENARFGGTAPALPRIPSQFSQRPPPPPTLQQQHHGFEREYPTSPAAPFSYSPPNAHSQQHQHVRQTSDYFNTPRGPPSVTQHDSHGSSEMDIVQDNSSTGNATYARQAAYDTDSYEMERDERYARKEPVNSSMSMGSSPERP
ncbi:hypothetical protein BGX28_003716 [Mortierella sp. GBA30]|nr:hypothetical protein BGX28_003716 [Mortierella sp. GBA30]